MYCRGIDRRRPSDRAHHQGVIEACGIASGADLTLSDRISLEHGRQRDIQGFANLEETRCADAVFSAFVFLNLLERDAQFFAKLVLAHTERQPLLAHPSADVSVDGTCTFRREFFRICLLHTFSLAQTTLRAPPYNVHQAP
jgi:hypothetical protein